MAGSWLQCLGPPFPQHAPLASTSYSTTTSHCSSCPVHHQSNRQAVRQSQRERLDNDRIEGFGRLSNPRSEFWGKVEPEPSYRRSSERGESKVIGFERVRYVSANLSVKPSMPKLNSFEKRGNLGASIFRTQEGSTKRILLEGVYEEQSRPMVQNSLSSNSPSGVALPSHAQHKPAATDSSSYNNRRSTGSDEQQFARNAFEQHVPNRNSVSQFMPNDRDPSHTEAKSTRSSIHPSSSNFPLSGESRTFQHNLVSTSSRRPMETRYSAPDMAPIYYKGSVRVKQDVRLLKPYIQKAAEFIHRREDKSVLSDMFLGSQAVNYSNRMTTLDGRSREYHPPTLFISSKSAESPVLQPVSQVGQVAQMEGSSWAVLANLMKQKRKPDVVSSFQANAQKFDGRVNVELEPVQDCGVRQNRESVIPDNAGAPIQKFDGGVNAQCQPVTDSDIKTNIGDKGSRVLQLESRLVEEKFPAIMNCSGIGDLSIEPSIAEEIVEEFVELKGGDASKDPALSDGNTERTTSEVFVVDTEENAKAVVAKLRGMYRNLVHACDTEVADIDPKKESPVGHGKLICFSIYCGPGTDFGGGKCRLWVDVLGKDAVLDVFKPYFEDPDIKKVWHNYSFDKHILGNHGINSEGFYADTMHLARLHDSSRSVVQGGYSLEGLTADKNLMGGFWGTVSEKETNGKRSMKNIFGKPNIKKNGEEGRLCVVPAVEVLQTEPKSRDEWIHYSAFDTVCTWCLWNSLHDKLKRKPWKLEGKTLQQGKSMYDFYLLKLQRFGELLVQMEQNGMRLDLEHLAKIEEIALKQQEFAANRFKTWAAKRCPDAIYMNVGSDAQIRQLLFGGKKNRNDSKKILEMERVFSAANTENYIEEGKKVPRKTRPFTLRGLGVDIPVDSYTSAGWPAVGGAALKALAGKVALDYSILDTEVVAEDLVSEALKEDTAVLTSTGVKNGSADDLSVYGKAYEAFGGQTEGKEACMAFAALCEVSSINTLISNFIQPLQGDDIKGPDGRIHCSLNINTETGRLSARRPSLQNQPALEKDRYRIRQAFVASPGNSLIVADYGQVEHRQFQSIIDGDRLHFAKALNICTFIRVK